MTKDCVLCAYKLYLKWFAPVGLTSYYFKCSHNLTRDECKAEFSRLYISTSIFSAILILVTFLCDAQFTVQNPPHDLLNIVRIFTLYCNSLNTFLVIIFCIWKSEERAISVIGISEIMQEARQFSFENFISIKLSRRIRLTSVVYCFIVWMLLIINLLYVMYNYENVFSIFKGAVSLICFYLDLGLIFGYMLEAVVYIRLYRRCYFYIKKILTKRLYLKENKSIFRVPQYDSSTMAHQLRSLHKMNESITNNLTVKLKNFINPSAAIWLFSSMVTLSLNIYVLMKAALSNKLCLLDAHYFVMEFRVSVTSTVFLLCLIFINELTKTVSIRISYLQISVRSSINSSTTTYL